LPMELTMTAWSFSTRGVVDLPLRHAISAESITRISSFGAQDIANIAWAVATLNMVNEPLLDAIAS